MGNTKQVPYCDTSVKIFSQNGDLALGICASLEIINN